MNWLWNEWRKLFGSRKMLVPIIAMCLIPSLYSGTYLWTYWDPYGHLERLPVAVVNEDQSVEYQGKTFAIGNDLVNELKKDRSLEWRFMNAEEADEGIRNRTYYFEIFIPSDFSHRATTLGTGQPTPLELTLKLNEGLNYIVSKIGKSAVETIRQRLSEELSTSYAKAIYEQLTPLSKGFQKASDAASRLETGLVQSADGTKALLAGLRNGQVPITKLEQGASELASASGRLSGGAEQLGQGATKLSGGLISLSKAMDQLKAGSTEAAQGADKASASAKQLNAALSNWLAAHPDEAKDADLTLIGKQSKQMSDAIDRVSGGVNALSKGVAEAGGGAEQLSNGAGLFASQLAALGDGASKLRDGAASAADGIHKVAGGWNSLTTNVVKLSDGQQSLAQGGAELSVGLSEGAEKAASIHASDPLFAMLANPVHLKEQALHPLPNYGTGVAPFFVSLSLYIGALLFGNVFSFRATSAAPPSGWLWFLSKFGVLALISLVQSAVASLILIPGVGLSPSFPFAFFAFAFLSSLVYMSVVQVLITAFDDPGKLLGIIVLVLQLTATGGVFPAELTPGIMQALHGGLPMTYSVEGFRALLSTGDYALVRQDALILVIFAVVPALLTWMVLSYLHKKSKERSGLLEGT
ncbi:YhgE/Pip domain-containing protein [Paenibacillus sp. CF384]|uniref:YhgE/Pip domain-containing protein n=1 Tax=Paenibacillus sp. CF384 TaxID=1884382 RepID=UPI000B832DD0|nr:YhgE/Pip domain-containing protein [Paenibacillus sp. CF384]